MSYLKTTTKVSCFYQAKDLKGLKPKTTCSKPISLDLFLFCAKITKNNDDCNIFCSFRFFP